MRAERRCVVCGCALIALSLSCTLSCSSENVVLGSGPIANDGAAPGEPDAAPAQPDAAPGEPDAAPPVPVFSAPVAIAEIAAPEATDDDPSLSADLTLLYFNSEREQGAGQEDIWSSERAAPDAPWQTPVPVAELNTAERETGIALAADGLSIWWSSDRDGGEGGLDVYTAVRATRADAWSPPERVEELSSEQDDLVSAVSPDERTLLLSRRADPDDDYDLFAARRDDRSQPWSEPQPIAELNSDEAESDGFLAGDGAALLFTRDEDLMLAWRERGDGPFGAAVLLESLNSDGDDRDAWASQDLGYVVFSSDRSGSYVLYEASSR